MSKASTASNGFGVTTPAERNAHVKENLQPNYELAKRDKGGVATASSAAPTKSATESQKINFSEMVYDRLMSEQKRRQ